jgi:hypothetical protein
MSQSKLPSSRVFKSFYDSYNNWDNPWHRECVDAVLYHVASNRGVKEYKWKLEYCDNSDVVEVVRVLSILQPSLKMQHMKNDRAWVVLSWTGEFNVPSQYLYEKRCTFPTYPPVVREVSRVGGNKSKVVKNPWTGRLRSIPSVDYTEEE